MPLPSTKYSTFCPFYAKTGEPSENQFCQILAIFSAQICAPSSNRRQFYHKMCFLSFKARFQTENARFRILLSIILLIVYYYERVKHNIFITSIPLKMFVSPVFVIFIRWGRRNPQFIHIVLNSNYRMKLKRFNQFKLLAI